MSAGWLANGLLGVDFESTGIQPLTARIVTACVAYRSESDSGWTKTWIADAGCEIIPDAAVAIHGVTTEKAHAEGQPVADVAEEVRGHLVEAWAKGVPVVAYNASYDLTLLNAELVRAGHTPLSIDGPVLDPLGMDRALDRYRRGGRKLADVCAHYGVRHTSAAPGEAASDGAHEAPADVLAALRVLWRIGQCYPKVAELELAVLMEQQAIWHAEWADSIEAYWRSVGKGDSVERAWPIRRVEVGA